MPSDAYQDEVTFALARRGRGLLRSVCRSAPQQAHGGIAVGRDVALTDGRDSRQNEKDYSPPWAQKFGGRGVEQLIRA